MELQIKTTTEKINLIGYLILGEIESESILRKEPKKLKNRTILHFMTTFHNVALKIETSFKLRRCLSSL